MKVILDTNVMLISLPKNSPYRPIFDHLRNGNFELGVTTDILLEYEEILATKTSSTVAVNVMKMMVQLENVIPIKIYYNWNLITADPDDNKYVDCALVFNADYIVTEDKHFNVLKSIGYPELNIINADEFLEIIKGL